MKRIFWFLVVLASASFFYASAQAQNAGTVTNHAFVVGKGPGTQGFTSLVCGTTQLPIGQSSADPICAALSGDVTMSASGVTAIGASKVTNAQFATMAANTTKCNATAGTANPTDCTGGTMRTNLGLVIGTNVEAWDTDLDCLAALSSTGVVSRTGGGTCSAGALALSGLATGTQDTVIGYFGATTASALAINNCTGALTYSTSTHTFGCNTSAGTGTVTSAQVAAGAGIVVSGTCTITTTGTCTIAQALTKAAFAAAPGSPTGTASATGVMMGLGATCTLTPAFNSRIEFKINAQSTNGSGAQNTMTLRFGTGAAPANGAALTGTVLETSITAISAGVGTNARTSGYATGLTPGTAYWFDVGLGTTAGTASLNTISCKAMEF